MTPFSIKHSANSGGMPFKPSITYPISNLEPDPLIDLFGISEKKDKRLTPAKHCLLPFASLLARRSL